MGGTAIVDPFLNDYDMVDLGAAYTLAYLKEKGLSIKINPSKRIEAPVDRKWNFGEWEENKFLIGCPNPNDANQPQALFALQRGVNLSKTEPLAQKQALSKNLSEVYLRIITHLILNKYPTLPCSNLKIALYLCHNNEEHWTLLIADFSGLNQKKYQTLYKKYWNNAANQKDDISQKTREIDILALIKGKKKGETAYTARLPISAQNITLTHYDSNNPGQKGAAYNQVAESIRLFIEKNLSIPASSKKNPTNLLKSGACTQQERTTCGDWSIFNAFEYGLLNRENSTRIGSALLEEYWNNLSIENAHMVLFRGAPTVDDIKEISDAELFCITQEARKRDRECFLPLPPPAAAASSSFSTSQYLEESTVEKELFNNPYPTLNWLGRGGLGAAVTYLSYYHMFPLLGNFTPFICVPIFISVATILCDKLALELFGQKKIDVSLNEKNEPILHSVTEVEGVLQTLYGVAPYKENLAKLEEKIINVLRALPSSKESDPIVTEKFLKNEAHRYAKAFLLHCPHSFYQTDQTEIEKEEFFQKNPVNLEKTEENDTASTVSCSSAAP